MSGWMANAFGKRDSKQGAREAIVTLREQLALIDKKEEHLERRVEEEHKKAKTLIAANKTAAAKTALKRKIELEKQRDGLGGTRLTLETQVNALESAHFNAETLAAMSSAQKALKLMHKDLNVDKMDNILDEMREQMENAQQISEAISTAHPNDSIDEAELLQELEELEQQGLDERLRGAESAPPTQIRNQTQPVYQQPVNAAAIDDEEEQLRQLQASLAM